METEAERRGKEATRAVAVVRSYAAAALSGMIANPHLMDAARSRSLAADGLASQSVVDWVVGMAWLIGESLAERETKAWLKVFSESSGRSAGPGSPPRSVLSTGK